VINVRGSYDQETESWIEHLTTDLGVSRIAILYPGRHLRSRWALGAA
jgi:hypothetical protein